LAVPGLQRAIAAAQFVLCALKGAASMLHCARDTPEHSIGPQ
jgi:hypothetical protein